MTNNCVPLRYLPSNFDVINYAKECRSDYHSKLTKSFPLVEKLLQRVYGDLQIPIRSSTQIRKKFECLIKLEGVYAKRPSDEVVQKMTELFPATKCICFLTQDSKLCDCDENGKIPEHCLAFFMDQIGPRILRLQCDCNDDHKVRIPLQGNPRSNDRGHLNHSDVVRVIFFFT